MRLKRVFERRETKYLLSQQSYTAIRALLKDKMKIDQYGQTTILSLYFDTDKFYFVNQSLNHIPYKEKFRVRSYGTPSPDQPVFLEMKKKINGVVYKRRLGVPYDSLGSVLKNHVATLDSRQLSDDEIQIKHELQWVMDRYNLEPKVLISGERLALYNEADPDFRVTFDTNIRFRSSDLSFAHGDYGTMIHPGFAVIMEVKSTGAYPFWFATIISQLHLVKGRFSKYGYVYEHDLYQQLGAKHVTEII